MQLAKRHNHINSGGNIGEESQFSIAVNAKMFQVLSDTMYQDKIGSIVREISCNAKDAHTEAGTPELPFAVHIPNAIEPWFSVRDFGIGLSDTDVRVLYTTYGESTRDHTNEVTGGFGLGSKTPFAYTDQFTIISIYGGMQRTYIAVINDDGLPVLNLQDERESSEHIGLEIHMAVENSDFDTFRNAIIKQLRFFKVKPTLENNMGGLGFTDMYDEKFIDFQNDDLVMYQGGYGNPVNDLYIVQGEVGYPVSIELLEGITNEVKEFSTAIDAKGAWFEVPIGSISVTANRESISYDPETIKAIIQELKRISTSICKAAIAEIKAESLLWKKCIIYNAQIRVMQNAITSSVGDLSKFITGAERIVQSNKAALKLDRLKLAGLKIIKFNKHEYKRRHSSTYGDRNWRLSKVEFVNPDSVVNTRYGGGTFLIPIDDLVVIVRDTNSKPVARLKLYAEENDFPSMLVIEHIDGGSTDVPIKSIAFLLGMSESDVSKMSDMEAPAVTSKGIPSGKRARGYQYNSLLTTHNSSDWTPVMDLDDLGTAVYVGMERHSLLLDDDVLLVMKLAHKGKLDFPIVAVNQQTFGRIEKGKVGTALITPTEALKPIRKRVEELTPAFKQVIALNSFCDVIEKSTAMSWMKKTNIKDKVSSAIFAKTEKLRAKAKSIRTTYQQYETHLRLISDVHGADCKAQKAARNLSEKMDAKYPMLRHLTLWQDTHVKDAIAYINLVDNAC